MDFGKTFLLDAGRFLCIQVFTFYFQFFWGVFFLELEIFSCEYQRRKREINKDDECAVLMIRSSRVFIRGVWSCIEGLASIMGVFVRANG